MKKRAPQKCSKCDELGHNARRCPKRGAISSAKPEKTRGGRTPSTSGLIAELEEKVAKYQAAIDVLKELEL